ASLTAEQGHQNPDLQHARESLAGLVERLLAPDSGLVSGSSAVRSLLREARLVSSYIAHDSALALALADAAAEGARFDYPPAEAHVGRANALLRAGRADDALAALDAADEHAERARTLLDRVIGPRSEGVDERGDTGLAAQIHGFRAAAQLAARD